MTVTRILKIKIPSVYQFYHNLWRPLLLDFSFLIPTRERPELINRLFKSILETTANLDSLELLLGIDDDDLISQQIEEKSLNIKKVILPKGCSRGELYQRCVEASDGKYLMFINDDIIIRTENWDIKFKKILVQYPDDIVLLQINDKLAGEMGCGFPLFTTKLLDKIGLDNILDKSYVYFGIDNHIFDIFIILLYLGHERLIYFTDIIFEHVHYTKVLGIKVYGGALKNANHDNKDYLIFEQNLSKRKEIALKLAKIIDESANAVMGYQSRLDIIDDNYSDRIGYLLDNSKTHPKRKKYSLSQILKFLLRKSRLINLIPDSNKLTFFKHILKRILGDKLYNTLSWLWVRHMN